MNILKQKTGLCYGQEGVFGIALRMFVVGHGRGAKPGLEGYHGACCITKSFRFGHLAGTIPFYPGYGICIHMFKLTHAELAKGGWGWPAYHATAG
jgi:hypothetical protein